MASGVIETIPVATKTPKGAHATSAVSPMLGDSVDQTPEGDSTPITHRQSELDEVL